MSHMNLFKRKNIKNINKFLILNIHIVKFIYEYIKDRLIFLSKKSYNIRDKTQPIQDFKYTITLLFPGSVYYKIRRILMKFNIKTCLTIDNKFGTCSKLGKIQLSVL